MTYRELAYLVSDLKERPSRHEEYLKYFKEYARSNYTSSWSNSEKRESADRILDEMMSLGFNLVYWNEVKKSADIYI